MSLLNTSLDFFYQSALNVISARLPGQHLTQVRVLAADTEKFHRRRVLLMKLRLTSAADRFITRFTPCRRAMTESWRWFDKLQVGLALIDTRYWKLFASVEIEIHDTIYGLILHQLGANKLLVKMRVSLKNEFWLVSRLLCKIKATKRVINS